VLAGIKRLRRRRNTGVKRQPPAVKKPTHILPPLVVRTKPIATAYYYSVRR
jgi:hypothetical protein